jgi:hypothetical protein
MIAPVRELRQGCARCRELHDRFTDPTTPNPGVALYGWATHQLDDHATSPKPRPGCTECERYQGQPRGVRESLWERWAQIHFMKCQLAPGWTPQE